MLTDSLPYIKKVYTGIGGYTFSFKVFDTGDLVLIHYDSEGTATTLTTGQYSAVLNPEYNGGTATITDESLATPGILEIQRILPYAQDTDWGNNDPFSMELLEKTQDKLVMMIQQIGHIIAQKSSSWRGDWLTDTAYFERELSIGPDDDWYACLIDHISGVFADDVAAGKWEKALPLSDFTNKYNTVVSGITQVATDAAQVAIDKISAATSAANALVSEENADTSETNALAAETLAEAWASELEDVEVTTGKYSAYHWAQKTYDEGSRVEGLVDTKANKTLADTGAILLPQGTTAQRPSLTIEKGIRYNDTLSAFEMYDGVSWRVIGEGVPAGMLSEFAGDTPPDGYLACPTVPTNISRTEYPRLFAAIQTAWGEGDGSTTFGMPYFPEKYVALHTAGAVGVPTTGQIKNHSHPITVPNGAASVGGVVYGHPQNTGNIQATSGSNYAAGMTVKKCVKYR